MNIFVTRDCSKLSAQALDNKRVVKMLLETAQLLSASIFINSAITYDNLYKPTHVTHPCTIPIIYSPKSYLQTGDIANRYDLF